MQWKKELEESIEKEKAMHAGHQWTAGEIRQRKELDTSSMNRLAGELLSSQLTTMARGVEEFQDKVIGIQPPPMPAPLPRDRHMFRVRFLREELDEYIAAYEDGNFPEQIDAVIDLVYVAIGLLLEQGIDPLSAFSSVQAANMAKVRGETARGDKKDAQKPAGWQPPDHAAVILAHATMAKVSPAFLECTRIREERGAKYNQGSVTRKDHFPFGNIGHLAINWIKMIRIRSDVEGGTATRASLSEHLRDLINYLAFWFEELNGGIK